MYQHSANLFFQCLEGIRNNAANRQDNVLLEYLSVFYVFYGMKLFLSFKVRMRHHPQQALQQVKKT